MPDERTEADLAAYVDGELDPREARAVERLLAGNQRYRLMVDEMRQARRWLADLPRVKPPAGASLAADPTVARLERAALLGDDEPPGPTPLELWRRRLTSANALGLAASLLVIGTLTAAAYLLLPRSNGTGLAELAQNDAVVAPIEPADEPPAGPPAVPVPAERELAQSAAAPREDGPAVAADESVESEAESPAAPPPEPLPVVGEGATLLVARAGPGEEVRAAAGVVAASLTARGMAYAARPDAVAEVPIELFEQVARYDPAAAAALGVDAGGPLDGPRPVAHAVFVVPSGMDRGGVGDLARGLGGERRPLIAWDRPAEGPRGRLEMQMMQLEQIRGVDDPPKFAPDAGHAGDAAGGGEPGDAEAAVPPERAVYPNDRLSLTLRPDVRPPQGLPAALEAALDGAQGGLTTLRLAVDADGRLDLSPLSLPPIDALGLSPRQVAEHVELRLAADYAVRAPASAAIAERAEVPGGRTGEVLSLLRIDRDPFRPGDLVRIELDDYRRVEGVVAGDGRVDLVRLGTYDAGGRTAGAVQRDVAARLAADDLADLRPADADAGPPAVMNLSNRRAAAADDTADDQTPLVVLLLPHDADVPATRPTTEPAPDDWDFGGGEQ